ncbi:MAG: hypothetical protein HUJ58_10045 [Erysipelotrichaceae bacterium]|nr:hypothetical protein [Erysipelotrichaceae bacterium]
MLLLMILSILMFVSMIKISWWGLKTVCGIIGAVLSIAVTLISIPLGFLLLAMFICVGFFGLLA